VAPVQLPIGEILVAEFGLARARVDEALVAQRERGGRLGEVLIALRATTEEDVLRALSRQLGAPYLDNIEVDAVEADLSQRVPIAFAKQFHVLPLRRQNGGFQVATADPLDVFPLDDLRLALGGEVYPVAVPERVITSVINTVYDRGAGAAEAAEDLEQDFEGGMEPVQDIDLLDATDEAPIIRLINSLLYQAVKERASDIHVEPMEREILVRFRVDGVLHEVVKPPKRAQASISSRVKIMAGLNIAEKRLPQDGRIRVKIAGRDIDIRVSTMPTAHGEGIVMRLLDRSAYQLDLGAIGFTEHKRRMFEKLVTAPNGIVLVTGPTGSGKTTTLYAALTTINSPELKILTVEDPVEYQLKGVNQVQVNPKIDLTFASALRSFLRQDPDVILVGEIRDPETAEVAIQASLTGHLVLSTVHTNDAPGAVTRLVDMGVEPFLVSTTLIGVMAQRLVRTLCKDCRQPYTPKAEELGQLGVDPEWFFGRGGRAPAIVAEDDEPLQPGGIQLYHARGCAKCNHVGYVGRTGIYELAVVDDEVKTAILRSADGVTLRKVCIAGGMTPLVEDGVLKIFHGVTTAEEVISAARAVETGS
jgi:general secretion pathway protein E